MMTIYAFEKVDNTDCNGYGSIYFNVIASSEREAWKKACEIEHRENIIMIGTWNPIRMGDRNEDTYM